MKERKKKAVHTQKGHRFQNITPSMHTLDVVYIVQLNFMRLFHQW